MVPSTTFPNPRRFPQQQEVVKSTCRCMYWFRRLKYCAPCHPVVFAFAPSSCWLRLELFFWRLHELQRRAVGSSKALDKFELISFQSGATINFKGGRFCSLFRFGKLRRVPTHQLSSKQRAKSTPLKLIAAPDWKEINSNLSSVFEDPTARRWGSKKSLTCSFPVCYLIVSLGMMPVKSHRRWWWSLVDVGGLQCGSLHTRSLWRGGVFQFQKTEDDGNNFRFLSK